MYSKTCVKWPPKNRQNKDLNDKRYLNEGRNFCRMLPLEHSVILLTCIKRYRNLENQILVFLRVAVLHRFYCTSFKHKHIIWTVPLLMNRCKPQSFSHHVCSLSHLFMLIGSLYCKQYGPRSDCFPVFASIVRVLCSEFNCMQQML